VADVVAEANMVKNLVKEKYEIITDFTDFNFI